jgi:DNA-binding transcriptional ArsR family regulator
MDVTRRAVLEQLARASDAARRETTTVEALASELDADEGAIEAHLDGLVSCELARRAPDGGIRVTITGEELLELDVDDLVIVDPGAENSGG